MDFSVCATNKHETTGKLFCTFTNKLIITCVCVCVFIVCAFVYLHKSYVRATLKLPSTLPPKRGHNLQARIRISLVFHGGRSGQIKLAEQLKLGGLDACAYIHIH